MTREEAMSRFIAAREAKRNRLAELDKILSREYEKKTGLKPNYSFSI